MLYCCYHDPGLYASACRVMEDFVNIYLEYNEYLTIVLRTDTITAGVIIWKEIYVRLRAG